MRVIQHSFRRPELADPGLRLRPVFDAYHSLRVEGDYEYPRHQHIKHEVIFADRLAYRCELNGEELSLEPGQVLVVKPGDWHQDHLRKAQQYHAVQFRLGSVSPGQPPVRLFREGVRPAEQVCRGDYSGDRRLLRELQREVEGRCDHTLPIQDSLLEVLFWRIVRGLPEAALGEEFRRLPDHELRRSRLALVFEEHVEGNPTMADLAKAAGVSPRHLTLLCRRLFGQAPAQFLLQLKMRRAVEMLRYRGLRVKEVSEALGFANPFHFSRVFKRAVGYPPSLR
jgi:AraC-like DNA-binding protein